CRVGRFAQEQGLMQWRTPCTAIGGIIWLEVRLLPQLRKGGRMTCKVVGTALLTIMFAGASMSQTGNRADEPASQPSVAAQPTITIPLSAGTAINASLVNAVDSSRNKPGDVVTANVDESVTYQGSM